MRKQSYFVNYRSEDGKGAVAKYVTGYAVDKVVNGMVLTFGVRKAGKVWTVDELGTGLDVSPGHRFGKRADALAYVNGTDGQTGKGLAEVMQEHLQKRPYTYKAQCMAMDILKCRTNPWPIKEYTKYVGDTAIELTRQAQEQDAGELAERITERSPEAKALMDEGKLVVVDMTAENGAKATVAKGADGKAKAIMVTEHHDLTQWEDKEESMDSKRIDELEKALADKDDAIRLKDAEIEDAMGELKKARAELERVWKENEALKAQKPAREMPEEIITQAAEISLSHLLEEMQAWCAERNNVSAWRKGKDELAVVRVDGDTRPYREELHGLGFRFSKKGFWYYGTQEAGKQGKVAVA